MRYSVPVLVRGKELHKRNLFELEWFVIVFSDIYIMIFRYIKSTWLPLGGRKWTKFRP